jgi:ribonuclease D
MDDNTFLQNISKEQIDALPQKWFPGNIHLIENNEQISYAGPLLSKPVIFGFDTETRPSFKKGRLNKVSLLQLATSHDAFLFRINHIGIPDQLIEILENPDVLKIGLAIKDDLNSLQKIRKFSPSGFIELQQYVKNFSVLDNGLKKLSANILGFKISKRQQTSNWEKEKLDSDQQMYAATDAWVCYEIYKKLVNHF